MEHSILNERALVYQRRLPEQARLLHPLTSSHRKYEYLPEHLASGMTLKLLEALPLKHDLHVQSTLVKSSSYREPAFDYVPTPGHGDEERRWQANH